MQLIIVESPHQAKTIEKFLKGDFKVDASKGHIRDLPVSRMGVNINGDFEPYYEISADKKADIKKLKDDAMKAERESLTWKSSSEWLSISRYPPTICSV